MPFQREELAKRIADRLNVVAGQLKTRSRASFTDSNNTLEFVMARFFNALLGWNLTDLNAEQANFPAADLGDRGRRIAVQITNQETSQKICETKDAASRHGLGKEFDRLIVFFLLPKKPGMPKKFAQPKGGPKIETWDLADLLTQMKGLADIAALAAAAKILDEELGSAGTSPIGPSLHQLPPNPLGQGFVGRSSDLETLRAMNPSSGAVLTGLRGMGGIGKTALALVLAHEWASRFPDAQIFLDGRGTQSNPPSAGELLARVIQVFLPNAKLPENDAALRTIFHSKDVLGGKRVLVLVDNVRDAAQVRPLIPPDGCALIVTSRQSFMLGTVKPHAVGKLPDTEAVDLLREYYLALTDDEATALVKLCAGLPLALRLAGAHLALDAIERGGTQDIGAYVKALGGGRLRMLDADAPDAGEVTISETLRLSEAQLSEAERDAWRRLGVFSASFDGRAAEAIAGADAMMLRRFVRRSMLEGEGAERFKLHDLPSDYTRERLGITAVGTLRLAHARHYTVVGEEIHALYETKDKVLDGLALFDCERAQFEAAYAWLAECNDDAASRTLVALVDAVADTCDLRFHPRQRIAWQQSQLCAARRTQDRQMESNALGNLGNAHYALGDTRKAMEFYEQALVIGRGIGDRRGEGVALGNLGICLYAQGDIRKAIEYYEQSLMIAREIGDRRGQGAALGNLGSAHHTLSNDRKAIEFYEERLVIAREIGDRRGEGIGLGNLATAHRMLGGVRKAAELYENQLVIVREIGDQHGEGTALWNSALLHGSLGNRIEFVVRATAALAIYEALESQAAVEVRAMLDKLRHDRLI